jgi:hypothetical protein
MQRIKVLDSLKGQGNVGLTEEMMLGDLKEDGYICCDTWNRP